MGFVKLGIFSMLSGAMAAPPTVKETPVNKVGHQEGILQLSLFNVPLELEMGANNKTKRQISTELENYIYDGSGGAIKTLGIALEFGTPPQKVIVEPDTASDKLWIQRVPHGHQRSGSKSTHFDEGASSSLHDLKRQDHISYVSEVVPMDIFEDIVSIGGVSFGKTSFGIANMTRKLASISRNVGCMGLTTGKDVDTSILAKLQKKNLVKNRAFSMALRKKDQGALIFGAYDTSKFSGPLEKFAIQPGKNGLSYRSKQFIAKVQSLSFNSGGDRSQVLLNDKTASSKPLTVGIDTGTPGLCISRDYQSQIAEKMGATVKSDMLHVSCDVAETKASLDFHMSNKTVISIPLSDFLMKRDDGKDCLLAIQFDPPGLLPADFWIGGHFLRRSLVVFDPDKSNLHIARGADCGSTVVAMGDTIPEDVVGKCEQGTPEIDPQAEMAPTMKLTSEFIHSIMNPRLAKH
ncbi:hypothetical protein QQS21_000166 [Conoideocrella luteorostrata]|uniref:Peptidase A1 domain-containing protein n=1 Tax=Conoideocrella luteorostrata TaxID=1105319 RepID=A0AAJ0FYN1_9HYPO|nr:hypothetical protein QQS21_000166 [Conoideocrella luteorostrata]